MTKLAPEWVRTSDPVIRSPARYRWTTAPAACSFQSSQVFHKSVNTYIIRDQMVCFPEIGRGRTCDPVLSGPVPDILRTTTGIVKVDIGISLSLRLELIDHFLTP